MAHPVELGGVSHFLRTGMLSLRQKTEAPATGGNFDLVASDNQSCGARGLCQCPGENALQDKKEGKTFWE